MVYGSGNSPPLRQIMASKRQRGKHWAFTIKRKGLLPKPVTLKFDTEAEGIAVCARLEKQLDAGILPTELDIRRRERALTLKQAVRRYLDGVPVPDSDRLLLGTLIEQIGDERLNCLDYTWAESWISTLKQLRQLSPSTIRHYVGALARCMDWQVRRGVMEVNPLRLLPKKYATYNDADRRAVAAQGKEVRYDVSRDRRLDESEEPKIRAVLAGAKPEGRKRALHLDEHEALRLVFELALETAMRLSEIYTLTSEQINLSRRTIYLDRTKNGDTRQVPLSTVAVAKLERFMDAFEEPLKPGDRLFPWWDGTQLPRSKRRTTSRLSGQFGRIFRAAGCDGLHFHDLRHEATCRLFERTKLQPIMIAKITGHRDSRLLQRYLSLRGSDLAEHLW